LELTTKRSNLWYILPIVFGILGGIIAGLIIRKNDPRKALICVIVGTAVSGLWIAWIFLPDDETEESTIETPTQDWEAQYAIRDSISAISGAEQKRLADAQKEKQQEIAQIKASTALPDSCRGVNSMELDIYPTGKQCFSALNKRVEEWCLSQSKDCVTQFYLKLADTCEDPILSSVEVCLMYTFKEVYPKLIP